MEPLVKSLRSKKFQKCLKTMPNRPLVDKWDMCKKVDPKNPWKVPHLCLAKNSTRQINRENLNLKDGGLVTCK
jgi:hypothetical protein